MSDRTERMLWKILLASALAALAVMCSQNLRADELDGLSDRQIQLHAESQRHRVNAGLKPQKLDAELCRLCQAHAERQAASGRMFHGAGDNCVAYGTTTAPATIAMWLGSPPHRAWLLSGTERAGWGAARSSGGTWYWAAAFRGSTSSSGTTYTPATARRWRLFRARN